MNLCIVFSDGAFLITFAGLPFYIVMIKYEWMKISFVLFFLQVYNSSQHSKRAIHKAIMNGSNKLVYYNQNARMVPTGLNPRCHKMHITVTEKFQIGSKSKAFTAAKSKAPSRHQSKGCSISKIKEGDALP